MIYVHIKKILQLFVLLCSVSLSESAFSSSEILLPDWWGNDIGKEEIVLPGYSPLQLNGTTLALGSEREYVWNKSFLINRIISKGVEILRSTSVQLQIDGVKLQAAPDKVSIVQDTQHHVIIKSEAKINNSLILNIETRVEYDGVAMIEIRLLPLKPVKLDFFHVVYELNNSPWMKMLLFKPEDIGKRVNRVVFDPHYSGGYLSALALADGSRSFWLFQDDAKGWSGKIKDVMTVTSNDKTIAITQKMVSSPIVLDKEKVININMLATPVKSGVGNKRSNRVARNSGSVEGRHHGLHLWWVTAFAHQLLPYSVYPDSVEKYISLEDKKVYPGIDNNKKILAEFKRSGIDRLPYFSGHVLHHLDPAYSQFHKQWEVHPIIRWNKIKYDAPFSSFRNDTFLTHRADGYSDYLLYRFSHLIDELGFEGLYFDQGGPRLSFNPENGLWYDSNGNKKGSTDIMALRDFHKRLATLFFLKGKQGHIVSHNSNDMIIPAYSFATGMVQGEEFNHLLSDYDYIDSISLDDVRTRLSGASYGVPTIWLEVIFAESKRLRKSNRPFKMSKADWHDSIYYERAYKNFMSLALLHDMPTWSYANLELRTETMSAVDWIDPDTATFVGYWDILPENITQNIVISFYRADIAGKFLLVVSNLTDEEQVVDYKAALNNLNLGYNEGQCKVFDIKEYTKSDLGADNLGSKSFNLLPVICE